MDSDVPSWAAQSSPSADIPSWAGSSAAPAAPSPQPQSKWSNIGAGLAGAYKEAVTNGLLMQPVRYAAEHMDAFGVQDQLRAKYPGQSDDWYQQQAHNIYGNAVTIARQKASDQVSNNPYPGHQIGNTIAAVAGSADPTWLMAPGAGLARGTFSNGVKAAVPQVAKYVGKTAAKQAVIGSAANDAAQLMDIAEGQKKDYDVTQNLQASAMAGAFGAAHATGATVLGHPNVQGAIEGAPVPDFVKNLFLQRGVDTTPSSTPEGRTSALTGQRVQLSPDEQIQFKNLLKTGNVDQIKEFLQGKNGPQPTWAQVNQMVETRDSLPFDNMPNADNVRNAFDQAIDEHHRQLVSDHIDAQTADWKNKPNVEVINHVNDIQDPNVRAAALADGVSHENTVGFVGGDGTVRVFAPQVKTPEAVNAVLFHEALGHYGLQQQFGAGLDKVLDTLAARNVGQFGKAVDEWQKANPDAYGGNRTRAAEEVMAEKSQEGPLPKSWGDAVISHVRRFGRQMGLKLSYSDAEVNHILAMAHDAVINGKGDAPSNLFNHAPQAVNDNHGQWLSFPEAEPQHVAAMSAEHPASERTVLDKDLNEPKFNGGGLDISRVLGGNPESTGLDLSPLVSGHNADEHVGLDVSDILGWKDHGPGLDVSQFIKDGDNKFMTPQQLNRSIASGDYQVQQMERAYNATDRDYVPTVRSREDVIAEAQRAGWAPSKVKNYADIPDLSKRVFQTQAAAKVLDDRISGILAKWDTPELTQGDKDNLRQALIDHSLILAKLRDDRAEIARALNMSKMGYTRDQMQSFGEILRESGTTLSPLGDDDTLNRFARSLKTLMAGGHNPAGVNALVAGINKPHWEDYLTSFHQNMMLSGLSTHVKAPLDMMIGIGRDLLDNASALPMGMAREALRSIGVNVKEGVHPTETAARLWGIMRAALDASTYANTADAFINGRPNPTGFGGRPEARIPIVSKVSDLITAQDQFFRAFATNMHLYGLGTRQALEEARANGTPKDWDTIMTQGSNYARNPSIQLLTQAKKLADENLLLNKNQATAPLDWVKRQAAAPDASAPMRAAGFITNFIAPFVRVEANSLWTRVVKRSPLALLDKQTLSDLKAGGPQADVAMMRVVLGTAALASYWAAAGQKKTTGEGPENPAKKQVLEATGWRPNAVHENGQYNTGNKLGISLNPFDVHNQTASMVADLREAYEKGANQGQVATGFKLASISIMKSLADMSWVHDIAPAIDALTAPNASVQDKIGMYAGDQASTMTPNLFGQAARVSDQGQPMTLEHNNISQTVKNSVMASIPGLRGQLPKKIDPLGGEVQSGASIFGQHTWLPQTNNRSVAGNHVDETQDPVKQEIGRLSEMYEENIVSPVQRTITVNGEKRKLSNAELSEYQRMAGHEIVETLRDEMSTPEWSQMSDDEKAEWIRDMQKERKAAVREYLYGS